MKERFHDVEGVLPPTLRFTQPKIHGKTDRQADGRWPFMVHPTEPNGAFSSQVPRARFNVRLLNVDFSVMTCQGSLREHLSFSRMDTSVPLIDLLPRSVPASKSRRGSIAGQKKNHFPPWNLFKSSLADYLGLPVVVGRISRSPFHTNSAAAANSGRRHKTNPS